MLLVELTCDGKPTGRVDIRSAVDLHGLVDGATDVPFSCRSVRILDKSTAASWLADVVQIDHASWATPGVIAMPWVMRRRGGRHDVGCLAKP